MVGEGAGWGREEERKGEGREGEAYPRQGVDVERREFSVMLRNVETREEEKQKGKKSKSQSSFKKHPSREELRIFFWDDVCACPVASWAASSPTVRSGLMLASF
eukprot:156694-Hanusia_phi.AAC.2